MMKYPFYGSIFYGSSIYGVPLKYLPPERPKKIYVIREKDYNIVWWEPVKVNNINKPIKIKKYKVYRTIKTNLTDFEYIGSVESKDLDGNVDTVFIDFDVEESDLWLYKVLAVSEDGILSDFSDFAYDFYFENLFYNTKVYLPYKSSFFWWFIKYLPNKKIFDTEKNLLPLTTKKYLLVDFLDINLLSKADLYTNISFENINFLFDRKEKKVYQINLKDFLTFFDGSSEPVDFGFLKQSLGNNEPQILLKNNILSFISEGNTSKTYFYKFEDKEIKSLVLTLKVDSNDFFNFIELQNKAFNIKIYFQKDKLKIQDLNDLENFIQFDNLNLANKFYKLLIIFTQKGCKCFLDNEFKGFLNLTTNIYDKSKIIFGVENIELGYTKFELTNLGVIDQELKDNENECKYIDIFLKEENQISYLAILNTNIISFKFQKFNIHTSEYETIYEYFQVNPNQNIIRLLNVSGKVFRILIEPLRYTKNNFYIGEIILTSSDLTEPIKIQINNQIFQTKIKNLKGLINIFFQIPKSLKLNIEIYKDSQKLKKIDFKLYVLYNFYLLFSEVFRYQLFIFKTILNNEFFRFCELNKLYSNFLFFVDFDKKPFWSYGEYYQYSKNLLGIFLNFSQSLKGIIEILKNFNLKFKIEALRNFEGFIIYSFNLPKEKRTKRKILYSFNDLNRKKRPICFSGIHKNNSYIIFLQNTEKNYKKIIRKSNFDIDFLDVFYITQILNCKDDKNNEYLENVDFIVNKEKGQVIWVGRKPLVNSLVFFDLKYSLIPFVESLINKIKPVGILIKLYEKA